MSMGKGEGGEGRRRVGGEGWGRMGESGREVGEIWGWFWVGFELMLGFFRFEGFEVRLGFWIFEFLILLEF